MIKNKKQLLFLYPHTKTLLDLADEALLFLQPKNLIAQHVKLKGDKLIIDNKIFNLKKYKNIFIIGAGKATYQMAVAIDKILKKKINAGYINVPQAYTKKIGKIIVNQARHPLPNINGARGAKKILSLAEQAQREDLVICLMSGGGSALLPLPVPSLSLNEKINLTNKLLKCSANIKEINTIRKHISAIKGGRLAQAAMPATMVSLYISDVVGDNLNIIASGPTVPDTSTSKDALGILKKYKIENLRIKNIIRNNESPKKLDKNKVFNFIIGNNEQAIKHLIKIAKKKKYKVNFLTTKLQGEARIIAKQLTKKANKMKNKTILIAGGETTVKVKGCGYGGRNQELVLAAGQYLDKHLSILSLATDGVDGITPYPVAGAVLTGKQNNIKKYLNNNDSFTYLQKIHSLLKTGLTGTNVGDIIMFVKN
jgi:hydroxypyruvate reductase